MAIPTFEEFMMPLRRELTDGQTHRMRELTPRVIGQFSLTEEEIARKIPSGQARVVLNRIGWARSYLKAAGLVSSSKRGHLTITDLGCAVLAENLISINQKYLERFESFREFKTSKRKLDDFAVPQSIDTSSTPEESIEAAYEQFQQTLASDLLDKLRDCTPYFFETVVVRLLRAMGYGGVSGSGLVTPASHDGGIDGVIYEDKLGLDTVCVQAKRWEGTVGRKVVQEFVGSMDLHRSKKGVILTTSRYSNDALDYVDRIEAKKVVLIDGEKLCQLMIEHRVGVTSKRNYELLDISEDFFDEDE